MSAKVIGNESRTPGSNGDSGSGAERSEDHRSTARGADPDVALVCGVSGDGQGVDIIRKRGDRIETGTVRRLEQGKPILGEVVRLKPRESSPLVYDVEVEVEAPAQARAASPPSSGPAQVATDTYRKNWDAIYGRPRKPQLLN